MRTKNTWRTSLKSITLAAVALLVLTAGVGVFRTDLAHAATTIVVVGQTNGGGATGVNQFNSASITVTAGDTVTWNSALDARSHDVVSAVVPGGAATWASPTLRSGTAATTFSTTVSVTGTYTYFCSLHAAATDATLANISANITAGMMVGRIVVNAPVADTTPPTVSAVAAAPNPTNGAGAVTLTATVTDTAPAGATASVTAAEWSKGASAIAAGTGTAMTGSFGPAIVNVTANVPVTEAVGTVVTLWVRGKDAANLWSTAAVSTTYTVGAPAAGSVQATVSVTGGSLSNTAQSIAFPGVTLTGADQLVVGATAAWQAQDARGTGAGWNVTVTSSNFTGTGGSIAVANFKLRLPSVTTIAGNTAPTPSPASYVALSNATPLKILSAAAATGMGTYGYTPETQLTVPGSTSAGSYTANVSVSINSGP